VPLTEAENKSLSLTDVPATFVQAPIPGHLPNNFLLPDFLEQLQPHQILAGEEPVMKLRLTHISDGCVLGISVSHMLAGIDSHFGSAVQCNALLVHSHLDAANRVTAQHVRWQVRQVHQLWCGPSSTGCCLHQLAAPCHSVGVVQDVQAQTRTCELPASLCIGMRSL